MSMDRRGFIGRVLSGLAGAAVASVVPLDLGVDLDRLLWVPGAKTIFLPSIEPVYAPTHLGGGNRLVGFHWITYEYMRVLKNNLEFSHRINREYDNNYARSGQTINVKLPARFTRAR